jgi:hypothetical protein
MYKNERNFRNFIIYFLSNSSLFKFMTFFLKIIFLKFNQRKIKDVY